MSQKTYQSLATVGYVVNEFGSGIGGDFGQVCSNWP